MPGARTLQTTLPSRVIRVIQASGISVTRMSPLASGVEPFGYAKERGGSCLHLPSLPHWPMTVDVSGSMNWIRQLRMSAVDDLAVGQQVRVVGIVEVAGLAALGVGRAEGPRELARLVVDDVDVVVVLLVDHQPAAVGREEHVVVAAVDLEVRAREIPRRCACPARSRSGGCCAGRR